MQLFTWRTGRAAAIAASVVAELLNAAPAAAQSQAEVLASEPFRLTSPSVTYDPQLLVRRWDRDAELGASTLALSAARRKTVPVADALSVVPRDKLAAWEATARLRFDIASKASIGLAVSTLFERRRPAGVASSGHKLTSLGVAVAVELALADRTRISAGWFQSGPRGVRSRADRVSELGGGAVPDARGFRLAANLFGSSDDAGRGSSISADARLQRVGAGDATLIGRTGDVGDARLALTIRTRF